MLRPMFDFNTDDDLGYQRPQTNMADVLNSFLSAYQQRQQPQQQSQYQSQQQQPNNYYGQYSQSPYGQQNSQPSPNERFGANSNLMDMLRKRESSGNYRAENKLGFTGGYQFGAPALETIGYLKKGAGKLGNKALNDPKNWTIPGGKEAFLSNPQLQDRAMQMLMASNKKSLTNMGYINEQTDPRRINAMLAAAHLSGPGGVKALLSGKNRRDAFGTPASEYFNMGMRAREG
jgi:hypothetical protein